MRAMEFDGLKPDAKGALCTVGKGLNNFGHA